jgi:hypothetical protein
MPPHRRVSECLLPLARACVYLLQWTQPANIISSDSSYQAKVSLTFLLVCFRTALAPRGCMCACVLPLFVCMVIICIDIFRG